jgi:hypothetical protein
MAAGAASCAGQTMSRNHKERQDIYAIIRYDGFHAADTPVENKITVKEIVLSLV